MKRILFAVIGSMYETISRSASCAAGALRRCFPLVKNGYKARQAASSISRARTALYALLSVTLMAGTSVAMAAELKLGFVNRDRILAEAAPAKRAQTKLEKEFAGKDADLQKMAKQAKDLQTVIEKETVTMSDADRSKKERELANLNRDFQRAQREFREDLNLRRNEELAAVLERVNKVINQIADQEKFDLILQEAVYISPRLDITDKVLKALADK